MRRVLNYFFACLLTLFASSAPAAEKVVLQLKWEHEFQFAGYYAALWQGFYESEGLDVEIRPVSRPDGSLVSPAQEVSSGNAHFAIGATDILVHRDQGAEFVVLAPIFQRSPNAIFALQDTQMESVEDLAKLTIASIKNNFTTDEINALLNANGVERSWLSIKHVTPTIDALLNKTVDAISTYGVSATFSAQEKNIKLKELLPAEHGLDFYGDTLYTHRRVIQKDPEIVEKFVRATLKGWQYALNNKQELATKISQQLPRHLFSYDDSEAYNLAFAEVIEEYMAYPVLEIGHINLTRWQNMHAQLKEVGLLENEWDENLVFNESMLSQSYESGFSLLSLFTFITFTLIILTLFFMRREIVIWIPCVFLLFAIVLIENFLEANLKKDQYQKVRIETANNLNVISVKLSGALNNSLSLISATAAYIGANPDIDQDDFERFAKPLFREDPQLINLAPAKDMVVNLIYPLAGNEAVIGLDYLKHEADREDILQIKNMHSRIVTDPVNLVQGGKAFIGRVGVYTGGAMDQPVFWGIVSGPIDSALLLKRVGLLDKKLAIDVSIRNRDNLGRTGPVFFGDETIFNDKQTVKTTLIIGDTTWVLAAAPKSGWYQISNDIWGLRFTTVIIAVLLMLFLTVRHRQLNQSKTHKQKLHQSEKLLSDVGELALIGPWKINPRGHISNWHVQTSKVLGLPFPVSGMFLEQLASGFPEDQLQQLKHCIDNSRQSGEPFDLEIYRVDQHQNVRWLRFIGDVVPHPGNVYDILGAVQDISERKNSHELIQYQASYDNLTGLPNRLLLNESLEKNIAKAKRDNNKLAILFIDLDNFKPVNDSLGHKAGDKVLKEVAKRLKNCIRASDTAARYSGDEFIILLQDVDDGSGSLPVAEQVIHSINQPINIDGLEVFCGASIGVAIYPEDGETGESLICNADQAMYVAKESGRNNWHYFTDEMQRQSEKRHRMHSKLVSALSNDGLSVFYQPIIDLKTGQISKCESLVRWFESDGHQVPTEEFIGLAEEMGVINDIDFFVLERAGRELSGLVDEHGNGVGLSINVSPRIFSAKDKSLCKWITLIKEIAQTVKVTVEITERVLTQDSSKALRVLTQLKDAGISIAIDDFGTGYSSLSYLTKFPIDFIKIDRSFISNIGINKSDETLTETIIGLANKLSMQVIAEGIETQEQLDFLKNLGCDYAQGYLLGKPQSVDDFALLLEIKETAEQLPQDTSQQALEPLHVAKAG